jgi:hypothetical protein
MNAFLRHDVDVAVAAVLLTGKPLLLKAEIEQPSWLA